MGQNTRREYFASDLYANGLPPRFFTHFGHPTAESYESVFLTVVRPNGACDRRATKTGFVPFEEQPWVKFSKFWPGETWDLYVNGPESFPSGFLGAPRPKIGKIWKLDPFGRTLVTKTESKFLAVRRLKWVKNPEGNCRDHWREVPVQNTVSRGKIWKFDPFGSTLVKKIESKFSSLGRPKCVIHHAGKLSGPLA